MDEATPLRDRVPPHNTEAEQSLLGAMMLSHAACAKASELVTGSDFYRPPHRYIFEAILALHARDSGVDMVTVAQELQDRGLLEEAGGKPYLLDIGGMVPTTTHIDDYIDIVTRHSQYRSIIETATRAQAHAYEAHEDPEAILSSITMPATSAPSNLISVADALDDLQARIAHWATQDGISGITTGLPLLDNILDGLNPGITLLAARPSVGKSALSENIAIAAAASGAPVHIAQLEQNGYDMMLRMKASLALVDSRLIKRDMLTGEERTRVEEADRHLRSLPLTFDAAPGQSPAHIYNTASKAFDGRPGLLIVDYLQLMSYDQRLNQVAGTTQNMTALQGIYKRLNSALLVLSQLSRASEKENRKPVLSDLRESGAIEQVADQVLFIHRETPEIGFGGYANPPDFEGIVAKNRNGPLSSIPLAYLPYATRFFEIDERTRP